MWSRNKFSLVAQATTIGNFYNLNKCKMAVARYVRFFPRTACAMVQCNTHMPNRIPMHAQSYTRTCTRTHTHAHMRTHYTILEYIWLTHKLWVIIQMWSCPTCQKLCFQLRMITGQRDISESHIDLTARHTNHESNENSWRWHGTHNNDAIHSVSVRAHVRSMCMICMLVYTSAQ